MTTLLAPDLLVPPAHDDATRRQFLSLLAAAGLLTACGTDGEPRADRGPTTRTVRHAFGTTEIPTAPRRVVAALGSDDLELLLALGVVPVASGNSPGRDYDPWAPWLDVPREVTAVDWVDSGPSIESLAALEPDLIVGPASGRMQDLYDGYASLAPTIAVAPDIDARPWQERLTFLAGALGREQQAEQVLAESEVAVSGLREVAAGLRGKSVSFVIPSPGDPAFLLYLREGGVSLLLEEVGMVLNGPAAELAAGDPAASRAEVSTERYGDVAADLLLCSPFDDAQEQACRSDVFDNPLVTAAAPANARTAIVGFHWLAGGSPQQDLAVIEDVRRLVEAS